MSASEPNKRIRNFAEWLFLDAPLGVLWIGAGFAAGGAVAFIIYAAHTGAGCPTP